MPEGLAQDPPDPLRVLPGDTLTVQAISAEVVEYEGLYVDELGRVHVPLAGDVEVGGLTLTDAGARVEEALKAYQPVVRVSIRITEPGGHRATVLGAVATPGRVDVAPGTRLADLYALAGGAVVETQQNEAVALADLDGARLVRRGEPMPVSLRLAVQGDPRHNVRIRPGDHLYVPSVRGQLITVLGEVDAPTNIAFRTDLRLTQALAIAGGISSEGDRVDIRIVRGPLREPRVYKASLRALVNGNATDVVLAAGDIVYVTQEWTAHVGEVLSRLLPLLSTATTGAIAVGALQSP